MANYKSDKYHPGGGGVGVQYSGPGSSLKKNRKVGAGQDVKKKVGAGNMGKKPVGYGQDSPKEEKSEAKAEKKENRAIKDLQSAQKMETGAGQMPMRGGRPMGPPMGPPGMPGGAIPPAGRRPGKVARKVPAFLRRGK